MKLGKTIAIEADKLNLDMCTCSECNQDYEIKDLETEIDSEAGTDYLIHLCPNCKDGGCIDDYWPSYMAITSPH